MHLKRTFRGLAVVAASSAAVLAAVGPAHAAVDYTITTSGSTTGTTAVTATTPTGGTLTFEDTYLGPYGTAGNPRMYGCSFSATGTANNGGHAFTTGTTVTDAAGQVTPTSTSLSNCQNSLVGPVQVVPAAGSVWKLGLKSKSATGGRGILSGVDVTLIGSVGSTTCRATAQGYLEGTYANSTGELTLDSSVEGLTITNIVQTGGLCDTIGIFVGDPATGAGKVKLAPAPQVS